MKKLCLIIYTLSLLIPGCTHICKYSTLDELNTKIKDKEATIVLNDEQEFMGKDIKISSDSTFWVDLNTENKQSFITSEVSNIIAKNRVRGALEGLGLGLLGGAAIGAIIGGVSFEEPESFGGTMEEYVTIGGFLFGILGGLLGLPIGLALGSNDKLIIDLRLLKK